MGLTPFWSLSMNCSFSPCWLHEREPEVTAWCKQTVDDILRKSMGIRNVYVFETT